MVHPGVYVDHTGEPSWLQRAWAGVLWWGPRAALWAESALRAHEGPGKRDEPGAIHVAVDRMRGVDAPDGVRVHRRVRIGDRVLWNGDAVLTVTVTRVTPTSTDGELTVSMDGEEVVVPLTATDNWVRVADMSASSTNPPSSPANLNDGNTDSQRWGGGGAGGWNDGTQGAFPDTVTAAWERPVPLTRARVHTLDSPAYPAAAWGVRDYDLLAHVAGSWQTVAQVRANTSGVVESVFDQPVEADRLQIRILASNSGDYSRLIELEAYGT